MPRLTSALPCTRPDGYTCARAIQAPVSGAKQEAGMAKAGTVKTTVQLAEALWRRARIRAIEEDLDLQDIVSKALEEYLRRTTPAKMKEGGR